jgi:hypothetical protein
MFQPSTFFQLERQGQPRLPGGGVGPASLCAPSAAPIGAGHVEHLVRAVHGGEEKELAQPLHHVLGDLGIIELAALLQQIEERRGERVDLAGRSS